MREKNINYHFLFVSLQIVEQIRNAATYFSPTEKEMVDSKLLRGEIATVLTRAGVKYEAIKCKENPDYLALLVKRGVYTAMFSASPSIS